MKLTLGFSPCPNDTFMFDALVHNKIDTEGLEFEVVLSDVEQLNQWALKSKLDLTKLSFNAFRYCIKDYTLLDSGSALGRNCGPLLIKNLQTELTKESLIAIPGIYTTANLLLELAFPNFQNKKEVLFSEIEEKVLKNEVDAGLIIHENRFTYQDRGLEKVIDLGEFWEQKTSLPIPLGGIFIRGNFTTEIKKKVERVLKRSVEFAFSNPTSSSDYVKCNAQELDEKVIKSHIDLYVNEFSVSLGEEGRNAIQMLQDLHQNRIVD
tara:strand:- start:9086 stop:9880 length:795 start_codon:yes stop_codon:yes gene_type:complete